MEQNFTNRISKILCKQKQMNMLIIHYYFYIFILHMYLKYIISENSIDMDTISILISYEQMPNVASF